MDPKNKHTLITPLTEQAPANEAQDTQTRLEAARLMVAKEALPAKSIENMGQPAAQPAPPAMQPNSVNHD